MLRSIHEAIIKGGTTSKLAAFDLDDTLIISSAKVNVVSTKTGRIIKSLSPSEFNFFVPSTKHHISFDEFEDLEILKQATIITHVLEKLKKFYKSGIHVAIITARSSTEMIKEFFTFLGIDIHPGLIIACDDPTQGLTGTIAERKKKAILRLVDEGYKDIIFFDDNEDNLRLAKEIEKERKDVKVKTVKV